MADSEPDFSLTEVGIHGQVEVTSPCDHPDSQWPPVPRQTLPLGLPPIIGSLRDDIEQHLLHPERLPIHHIDRAQRFWPRCMEVENLYSVDICPVQTTIHVDRDQTTGKLIGFNEDFISDTRITSQNSLSMTRPPDADNPDLRGSGSNYPFWPGGLEEPALEHLNVEGKTNKSLFDELLTIPPGFNEGMIFTKKSLIGDTEELHNKGDNPPSNPSAVLKITDILNSDEDFGFGEKKTEPLNSDQVKMDAVKKALPRSESLENLIKVETKKETKKEPKVAIRPPEPSKLEWAVKVDINKPVTDFHKRIPVMARQWPFELDTFQKQAILHLEQHDCVFVAAHTSAGKTVVAEYATALSLRHLTKTIYTSPIKALSNQKFREFRNAFGDDNVGLVTGDVQLNQTASCLIMTTEILRSMLYNGSEVIRDLEWVVFDEVHYINDAERGVVWEEVLIMLPKHVNIILLSATVPNTLEFADWIGRTKQKKIYVISTLKRPVPLEHFLYTGNSGKTSSELFLLVDAKGSFLTQGYMKAVGAKKERASKFSQSFGAKGTRGGNPQQVFQ